MEQTKTGEQLLQEEYLRARTENKKLKDEVASNKLGDMFVEVCRMGNPRWKELNELIIKLVEEEGNKI